MRKYTIPQPMMVEYFLGDHLGSTSITTDSNGAKVSEMRYTAWGEVRYSWESNQSTTPAYILPNYTFTGQYSDSYINLLWYGSRHYDPELGRFIQPDSIVPLASQGVQAWDRYAYVNNNPVRYNDPTGHTPAPCNFYGTCPDADGIAVANLYMSPHTRSGALITDEVHTYTAVGIAVQSEWPDIVKDEYSGEGPAQVSDAQMNEALGDKVKHRNNGYGLGMPGQNQNNGYVASVAMRTELDQALKPCHDVCTNTDKFIIAALAQNGPGFTKAEMTAILNPENGFLNNDGTISWEAYFTDRNKNSDDDWFLKQRTGGLDYDTSFMLHVFYLDAKEMEAQGWYLPDDLDEERIKRLFNNTF
jgi:RHS repeat-associated protein